MTVQTRKYNLLVVDKLLEKYGFTKYYIRQCVSGNKKGITPDIIKREYDQMVAKIEEALNNN